MSDPEYRSWQQHCPLPTGVESERILLAHGEGGRLARRLIQDRIVGRLANDFLGELGDAARLPGAPGGIALTTDSFVVSPLFFPGGDIGTLSVFGTTNDLAVSGATPLYLTLAFILEEGLPVAVLEQVLERIASSAVQLGVQVVAGDTKVVPRGAADGMFINTTGLGRLIAPPPVGPRGLCPGDTLIVTGPIGRHGIAVLCAREDLALQPPPVSDCASLAQAAALLQRRLGDRIRAMRDATRGGVSAVLHEWAAASGRTMSVEECHIPVSSEVRGACELLGLDPLYIANEGTMVVAVEPGATSEALATLRSVPETAAAVAIGRVIPPATSAVLISRALGPPQPLEEPTGAPLPRIC